MQKTGKKFYFWLLCWIETKIDPGKGFQVLEVFFLILEIFIFTSTKHDAPFPLEFGVGLPIFGRLCTFRIVIQEQTNGDQRVSRAMC